MSGNYLEDMHDVVVHFLHAGEFGIVYKADLASKDTHAATSRVVAVKTLKGSD